MSSDIKIVEATDCDQVFNMADYSSAAAMLLSLSEHETFVLSGQIAWMRQIESYQLITGTTFAITIAELYGIGTFIVSETIDELEIVINRIGRDVFRDNVCLFFEAVTVNWHIEPDADRDKVMQLHRNFLRALANVFADHSQFWYGDRLLLNEETLRCLASIDVNDVRVKNLFALPSSEHLLYELFKEYLGAIGPLTLRKV